MISYNKILKDIIENADFSRSFQELTDNILQELEKQGLTIGPESNREDHFRHEAMRHAHGDVTKAKEILAFLKGE